MKNNIYEHQNDAAIILNKLKNGTDIRGIAIDTEEDDKILTPGIVSLIGYGFSKWLKERKNGREDLKVAVGVDSRLSGPELKEALKEALICSGINVYDCGMSTTPAMFMATVLDSYKCDGAVMITASHLPYYYNGLKFFTEEGGCEKADIDRIVEMASCTPAGCGILRSKPGTIKEASLIDDYSKMLVDKVRKAVNEQTPLKGSRIIVDAGNGSGGFFATKVLQELGADIQGSQFLNPDGNFPNHIPNPENKEAMESIKNAVLNSKADLGIIFDTDVDRAAIVSKSGEEINKNALIALISSIVIKTNEGATVVTDSVTSTGLAEFIAGLNGVHHRFKRGYKNVINEAIRLNEEGVNCPLAIETSGHAALRENYFLDDGAYLVIKILIEMSMLKKDGKDISELIKDLKHPLEEKEIRKKIKCEDFRPYGQTIIENLKEYAGGIEGWEIESRNYEGVKINCSSESGWFLIRMSLHEPIIAINIESDIEGGTESIFSKIKAFLVDYDILGD